MTRVPSLKSRTGHSLAWWLSIRGDIWQCLEIFGVVPVRKVQLASRVEARDAVKRPAMQTKNDAAQNVTDAEVERPCPGVLGRPLA